MRRVPLPSCAALVLTLAPSAAARPAILLNEVLYDPIGADGGQEFIELTAATGGDPEALLAGWILETGNGARPGEWTVAWVGGAGDRLRGGLFVVGESGVEPRPDAVAHLDLQNGPDACRLRGPAGEQDRLGWGTPLDDSFREGSPAEDTSGLALARLPDGVDTDDNARDFRASRPSPGDFNAPEFALLVEEFAAPPASSVFAWTVRNVGRVAGAGHVSARCSVHPGEVLASGTPGVLAPGAAVRVEVEAPAPAGVHLPVSDPPAAEPKEPWRGLHADLLVSEVMNRPRPDGTEWVEIRSVAGTPVDLAAFGLADAAGGIAAFAGTLSAGGFAIVAADTSALRHDWSIPPGTLVTQGSPWPALNHTASAAGPAERVILRIGETELVAASLPGGAAEDVSWEAVSRWRDPDDPASWAPSLDVAGGTPGRRNSRDGDRAVPTGMSSALSAHPGTFHPARDGAVLFVFRAPLARECRIMVYDSSGLAVATLAPWLAGDGEHRALWDGSSDDGGSAVLGLYLVRAEAVGARSATASLALVR